MHTPSDLPGIGTVLRDTTGASYTAVLLALALTAIVVGTGAPNFSVMYDTYTLHGAARRVVADLRKARISAATENNWYRLELIDSQTYSIHDDDDNDGAQDEGEEVDTVNLSSGWPTVTLAFSDAVTFRANATVVGSQNVTLSSRSGELRTVSISAAGRVRIEPKGSVEAEGEQ